jgi:uncharacterized 2Fe-2S/4Fe-4S cluster protein (DUF4445 family)
MTIWLLNELEFETIRILTTGVELPIAIESDFNKIYCELTKPSLENQLSLTQCLIEKIQESIPEKSKNELFISYPLLKDLHAKLEENDFKVIAVINGNEIVEVLNKNVNDDHFGIAVDLGTTTIVGLLVNLKTGQTVGVASRTNPQISYGADVITRINYTINESDGLKKLQSIVIESINDIIAEVCENMHIRQDSIHQFSLAGNSIMNHIFLGVDPRILAFSPYLPVYKESIKIKAKEIGLNINPEGKVFVLPNISGFVGGDIVGLICAHNLLLTEKITLALDLGTNGEIVLGSGKRLLSCATAAGPAFEGGHISSGMRASSGAIDKVSIYDNKLHAHVIDNAPAIGICGTGLLDLIAELLEYEIIDETGRISGKDELSEKAMIFKSKIRANGSQNEFIIIEGDEANKEIVLKQQDVRELQLAKGAIKAGITILQSELGITDADIDEILIAGAFGSYINKESAMRIGLIPKINLNKVRSIGNSASIGAKQYLLSLSKRDLTNQAINETEYIELCTKAEFQNRFMEEMIF